MIDDKKMEEEATNYAQDGYNNYDNNILRIIEEAFKSGAKWMQEEFLKDLWHPANEEPREFAEVLAEAKITESIKTYISFKRNDALFKNWDAYSSGANITRWLYIDDLFPKKGGEQ